MVTVSYAIEAANNATVLQITNVPPALMMSNSYKMDFTIMANAISKIVLPLRTKLMITTVYNVDKIANNAPPPRRV